MHRSTKGTTVHHNNTESIRELVSKSGGESTTEAIKHAYTLPAIMKLTILAVVLLSLGSLLPPCVDSAQILGLFTHPGKSHFDVFRPLFRELAAAGHNVTMISYFPNKTPIPNYTDYELSGVPILTDVIDLKMLQAGGAFTAFKILDVFMLHNWGMEACEVAFKSDIVKHLLQSGQKFDVILLEQFNSDCMMAIAHLLNAPVIALSSCVLMPWHYRRMGTPFLPSFMPMQFRVFLPHTADMSYVQRLDNFIHFHVVNFIYDHFTQRETNALIRKHFGPAVPPIEELVKNTSLFLINQHFTVNGAYPFTPNIVEVAGLHIPAAQPLEPKLQELLDNSKKGVIYISWGSMVRPETLEPSKLTALMNSMAEFPDYLVMMKWPNATIPNKPKNVKTMTWMPQRDILCHPNVKVFMNHGGLLGTNEAVYCAVPMLVTPFYGDQFMNAANIETRKLGKIVTYKDFTEKNIVEALRTLLKPDFAKNIKSLSKAYKSRPQQPLDLAIWWVEYIIRTGGAAAALAHNTSKNMNWFVRNSIDVYLFLTLCLIANYLIVRTTLKKFFALFKKNEVKTKLQ